MPSEVVRDTTPGGGNTNTGQRSSGHSVVPVWPPDLESGQGQLEAGTSPQVNQWRKGCICASI